MWNATGDSADRATGRVVDFQLDSTMLEGSNTSRRLVIDLGEGSLCGAVVAGIRMDNGQEFMSRAVQWACNNRIADYCEVLLRSVWACRCAASASLASLAASGPPRFAI